MRAVTLSIRVAAFTAAAALLATTATSAATASSVTTAGGPGHWSQVTPSGTLNIQDIGLAVAGHNVLNVLWSSGETSDGHAEVHDTPISAGGTVGKAATVIVGQYGVTDPAATVAGGHVDAIWNGVANVEDNPRGTFIATLSSRGHWSVTANVPPLSGIPFLSSSDSAATGADGKPWVAFDGTDSLTVLHLGQAEHEIPPTACCAYNANLAVDGKSGATYVAYSSLVPRHEGVYAQRLNNSGTADGKAVLMPGSVEHGGTAVLNVRVAITARGPRRSGVYVAYLVGYPIFAHVDVLQLGTRKPVTLASVGGGDSFAGAALTADSAGGLWAAWFEGDGSPAAIFVRQSNNAVTKWGKTIRVALPSDTSVVWKVYIAAQGSRLAVLALLDRHGKTAYWATQVR
jgi:hypothetical protein